MSIISSTIQMAKAQKQMTRELLQGDINLRKAAGQPLSGVQKGIQHAMVGQDVTAQFGGKVATSRLVADDVGVPEIYKGLTLGASA